METGKENGMVEYRSDDYAAAFAAKGPAPYSDVGDAVLVAMLPPNIKRFLDIGTGNGRLLALVKAQHPQASAIGLDFSPFMLQATRKRFSQEPTVQVIEHNLEIHLPDLGMFDAIVSSYAIHHLDHRRKRTLYAEVFDALRPGGFFCNFDCVSSSTHALHLEYLQACGTLPDEEDPSNQFLDLETQLRWLREIGFSDVDCFWKWREEALMAGKKPRNISPACKSQH
jgi:tRNA (cmo5U34)-methyltransferase